MSHAGVESLARFRGAFPGFSRMFIRAHGNRLFRSFNFSPHYVIRILLYESMSSGFSGSGGIRLF